VKLGETANPDAARYGKPLDGVRILAAEQMQSLPYATQLLARLGAEVVKVENPGTGDIGRGSLPALTDAAGNKMGCTFVRNNLGKKSIGIDLKAPAGRDLFLSMVPKFDVVAENFKPGTMDKFGLGYEDLAKVHPGVIYASISGFGNTVESEYRRWPRPCPASTRSPAGRPTRPSSPRSAASATPAPASSPSSASSPRSGTATAPARASTSTSPCTTAW
jgi:formyl-CoA transferase